MSRWGLIDTPFGLFGIEYHNNTILKTKWVLDTPSTYAQDLHPTLLVLQQEINKYLIDPNYKINCQLNIIGTNFQKQVWEYLRTIPCGTTLSYGQLARKMQSSARAIGQACKKNPFPLIIPCHRIVSKQNIGGFMGKSSGTAINIKLSLLKHEMALT
ncbi:MAG: methylated-DNA--[protein]-cysteine S-methyltransferase [Legionellales bacterium]|nr:methylated-DNA--[protein]-cysteine S-methyltransferase [Legionellales bacterium]